MGSAIGGLVAVESSQRVINCTHGVVVCFAKIMKRMVMRRGVLCFAQGFWTAGDSVRLQAWDGWMAQWESSPMENDSHGHGGDLDVCDGTRRVEDARAMHTAKWEKYGLVHMLW